MVCRVDAPSSKSTTCLTVHFWLGLERNKDYITKGVERLVQRMQSADAGASLIDQPAFYSHVKAACSTQRCFFLTNIDSTPKAPSIDLSSNRTLPKLQDREQQIGWIGAAQSHRSSLADYKTQAAQKWAIDYPYIAAVDGDFGTAWRSPTGKWMVIFLRID